MNTTLRRADGHHDKATKLYRDYLLAKAKKAGSVANLAALCKIPVKKIHEALDVTCAYIQRRNIAHEIGRKLGGKEC